MTPAGLLQMSGIAVDLIYAVEAVPAAGREAIVSDFAMSPGGGFNAMVAARRAGLAVTYGGILGAGPFADIVRKGLQAETIDWFDRPSPAIDQGCCSVLIDPQGERTFIASEGAEGSVSDEDLAIIPSQRFRWTLLSGYALHYRGSREALRRWLDHNDTINGLVFDPSPLVALLAPEMVKAASNRAAWISANREEAQWLSGVSDPKSAALRLASGRSDGGAIVRTGAGGCYVATGRSVHHVTGYPVDTIDTNGAGDAHIGNFIAAMADGAGPVDAARFANVAAALSTTRKGPATGPPRVEVDRVLKMQRAG